MRGNPSVMGWVTVVAYVVAYVVASALCAQACRRSPRAGSGFRFWGLLCVALLPTGEPDAAEGSETFPVFAFQGMPARLYGVELEGRTRLWRVFAGQLGLEGRADWTRADNLATGEPLPRVSPLRLTMGLNWLQGPWATAWPTTLPPSRRCARSAPWGGAR